MNYTELRTNTERSPNNERTTAHHSIAQRNRKDRRGSTKEARTKDEQRERSGKLTEKEQREVASTVTRTK